MSEWTTTTLGEISERVDYGYTASASDDPSLPRFLRITDIAQTHLEWSEVPGCPIDEKNLRKYELATDDIVVARTGATVGFAKRIREHPSAVFASYLVRFRLGGDADPSYVGAVVESRDYKQWVKQNAGGAAQPNASAKVLGAYRFRLPDRETQARIGAIFDSLADLVENNRRRVALLEEMAQAIYREWFVKFRYPGHEDVPLVDSVLGPIPEGWTLEPFDDVASFVNGFAFKPSHWGAGGRPIIKIKELKAGVTPNTPRCSEETIDQKYWIERGDLLMSWSADLGVYLWGDEPGLLNQHLFVVRPVRDGVTLLYLLHALDNAMPHFRSRAQGTTMKHIKRAALHEVSALIPPPVIIARFEQVVGPIHQESMTLQTQMRGLGEMHDLLLPKLVTGQIDVSTLDLDALVERVA